ncbi:FAD-dependent oxidoreductase [Rhizocola hellebori]|uniref:FAD-dependent oxidoreductase n=1 Tax=Rhizocola hellebori TaxID=1392758 RepID=A0A8J3QEY9_9ACTN|nr:FAD-dependent monooxygenase [Rhizocola hellebori]GIH08061.1 FAD-dependent oxidoreductase [Rhizocola hellebori]
MRNRTVLISGASIAGPALAFWLHKRGFQPTIVEVAPGLRPGGHAVDIRGVARRVVEEMGLMPQIRAASVPERGFALVDRRGKVKARLSAEAFGGEGIVAEIEIMRGDLSEILYRATESFTDYMFGDRITALDEDAEGVKVTFASGTVRGFDLVIGADGVHSGVRALAFGPEEDFLHYLGGYTAYFTVPDPGDLDDWFLMFNASGGLCAGIRPERGNTAKASLTFATETLSFDRKDIQEQKEILARTFAGVGWRIPQLLAAMWEAPDFYFDSICQVHLPQWSRGRVALVGDAAHCGSPLSGLGTSASLIGAYVLAGELASGREDHEGAFHRYQEEMKPFIQQAMELPPGGINGLAPRFQFMISLRNLSMRMMTRWPMRGVMARQAAKSGAIALKQYG